MSADGEYILYYDNLPYVEPTPMELDSRFLNDTFGGQIERINCHCIYYNKPKYLLSDEDIINLNADQILESRNGEIWKIVK